MQLQTRTCRLRVHCEDRGEDLCPHGHLAYAAATGSSLALPGAALAVSEFAHFRAFRFGVGGGVLRGQNLNRVVKYLLLPFYVVLMAPLALLGTIIQ